MKNIELNYKIQLSQLEELPEEDQRLVKKAIEATNNSYAPYSNFHVGACLRTDWRWLALTRKMQLSLQDFVLSARQSSLHSRSIPNLQLWP